MEFCDRREKYHSGNNQFVRYWPRLEIITVRKLRKKNVKESILSKNNYS